MHRGGLAGGRGDRRLSDGGLGLQVLELHLQLVEQFAATFRGGTEAVALQLGDQQLQVRHHRLGTGGTRFGHLACRAFRQQRGLQLLDILGQGIRCAAHSRSESQPTVVMHAESSVFVDYPARSGRQVRCGLRQSIPSNM